MYVVHTIRASRVWISFLAGCLVFLFVASASPFLVSASSSIPSHMLHPAISTSCPAPGTARAAALPSLTLGTHPTIVYIVNEGLPTPTFGTLKRYDVVTGAKVEIVKMAGTSISEAQVSANGQWLLFVAHVSGQVKLQLIRMDGKFLQTLYCGNPSQAQWSTNQQLVLFSDPNSGHIYLLHMTTGVLQAELSFSRGFTIHPRTWLDNTRAYVTLQLPDQPPESVAILDTSKGPNQNVQNLQVAFDASTSTPFCWDFDSSPDATRLFISQCTASSSGGPVPNSFGGPSVITVRPATGSSYAYLYVNQGQAFTAVRAVTNNTLLFTVGNTAGNSSQNGLWKVGTNGSNPAHLAPSGALNQFTQFPWSNVSRDSSKYVLQIAHSISTGTTYTLEYGSLSGGSPIVFASITNVQLATVGWTTM
jgi:eukaryotic-like serine/threonine-protein kinase